MRQLLPSANGDSSAGVNRSFGLHSALYACLWSSRLRGVPLMWCVNVVRGPGGPRNTCLGDRTGCVA